MRAFAAGEIDVLVSHHGDRGRGRRRQRHDDGGPRRRPVRGLAAAPAARPGRPRRPAGALPAGHRARRPDSPARERLDAVAATTDGFELSRLDLQQRREGDVLGAAQSGRRSSLRLLHVLDDEDVIVEAREVATALVADDPDLSGHPDLAEPGAPAARGRAGRLPGEGMSSTMTRIIGGDAGGRRLQTPTGDATRPTSDRVREALFSAVDSALGSLPGCASSTCTPAAARSASRRARAAPAWSRWSSTTGAPRRLIRDNVRVARLQPGRRAWSSADRRVLAHPPRAPYDVVFADPPYAAAGRRRGRRRCAALRRPRLARPGGAGRRRALQPRRRSWRGRRGSRGRPQQEVRRDHALVRSRHCLSVTAEEP